MLVINPFKSLLDRTLNAFSNHDSDLENQALESVSREGSFVVEHEDAM
jgi:hypothetical protein